MQKKSMFWMLSLLLVLSVFLAACSGNDNDNADTGTKDEGKTDDTEATDDGEPEKGGTLVYGIDTEPEGKFNFAFYDIATDAKILEFIDESLFTYDENLEIQPNLASWETEDSQHYTFTFEEGVKWHNGEELTVNDWVFALETIADKD